MPRIDATTATATADDDDDDDDEDNYRAGRWMRRSSTRFVGLWSFDMPMALRSVVSTQRESPGRGGSGRILVKGLLQGGRGGGQKALESRGGIKRVVRIKLVMMSSRGVGRSPELAT